MTSEIIEKYFSHRKFVKIVVSYNVNQAMLCRFTKLFAVIEHSVLFSFFELS